MCWNTSEFIYRNARNIMNLSTICNAWRSMATPLPLKARQRLAIQATLQQARAAARKPGMPPDALRLALRRGMAMDPYNTGDQL